MTKSPVKKLIIFSLMVALLASAIVYFTACSGEAEVYYDHFTFTRSEDGLILTSVDSAKLPSDVIVPEYYYEAGDTGRATKISVVGIGDGVFKNLANVKSVSLPSSVKALGAEAFSGCSGLKTVDAGYVGSVGANAFLNCTSLTAVTLSPVENITIGDGAFYGCFKLKTLSGGKITSLGANAFASCISLMSVDADWTSLGSVGERAFFYTACINSFEISRSCASVGAGAFEGWNESQTVKHYTDYADGWKNGSAAVFKKIT